MEVEVIANNIKINYNVEGEGDPLILLHGSGEDYHIFDKIIKKLKKNFTVYAIDSRNHGRSSKTDDFTYEIMVEDIYQFIKKLNLEKPSIVGFSDGAIISLMLAIKYPNLINKMALLGLNLKPTDFKKNMYSYLVKEYEKSKNPLFKMMLEQPNIELESLKDVNVPTIVIAGENDLFYKKTFLNVANTMQNAILKIMLGHDHSNYIIDQDILYEDFLSFFNGNTK